MEVILPPVEDTEAALKQILAPFNEQGEDGNPNTVTVFGIGGSSVAAGRA